jgi:mannose-6-phosphate isomerase-like protein (cupin superfamily)
MVGDEEFEVELGDLVITPPGVRHRIWTEQAAPGDTAPNIRVLEWAMKRA